MPTYFRVIFIAMWWNSSWPVSLNLLRNLSVSSILLFCGAPDATDLLEVPAGGDP